MAALSTLLAATALRLWAAAAHVHRGRTRTRWCSPYPGKCHGRPEHLVEVLDFEIHPGAFSGPFAVDWDGDGDLDLVVTSMSKVSYYERVSGTSLVLRDDEDSPFASIEDPWVSWPVVVDWDGDGDLDLLLATYAEVLYYERAPNGQLNKVPGNGPFADISFPHWLAPAVVDWDQDGDLDLLILAGPTLHYFERINHTALVHRTGDQSPFAGITLGHFGAAALSVADWDSDGDLDLVVGTGSESLLYFERVADGTLTERTRGANAFRHVRGGFAPFLVDWDQDGDLDLLVGTMGEGVRLFERQLDRNPIERTSIGNPFRGIDLGKNPDTLAVDWDQDGDVDMVGLNSDTGAILLFEHVNGTLVQHPEEDSPFREISMNIDGTVSLAAADWDSDGHNDLLVATKSGRIRYFRNGTGGALGEVDWADGPFNSINASRGGRNPAIAVVDWDSDGDADLIMGSEHGICYFKRDDSGALVEQLGDANPFGALPNFTHHPIPTVADWNNDGRLDLLVAEKKTVHYFERLADGDFADHTWTLKPFNDYLADVGIFIHSLKAVDWNHDGDVDLVIGTDVSSISYFETGYINMVAGKDTRTILYFETGWCGIQDACSARGLCHPKLGTCSCMLGYQLDDCSGCSRGYFSSGSLNIRAGSLPRTCSACPGMQEAGRPCLSRGVCFDDQSAWSRTAGVDPATLARGNGTCLCMPHFEGESCEAGTCPAGFEYAQQDLWQCLPCRPGEAKPAAGMETRCKPCTQGHFATADGRACAACPAGRSSARIGITECDPCPIGTFSARGAIGCQVCPDGTFASRNGSSACEKCASIWYRKDVDAAHTECQLSLANLLEAVLVLVFSFSFCFTLHLMLRPPLKVLDIKPNECGNVITTHGRHWLLWLAWKPTVQFRGTQVPWLDGGEDEAGTLVRQRYRVERQTQTQLLLCNMDGTAMTKASDTSIGFFRLGPEAFFVTGVMGVPFFCWEAVMLLVVMVNIAALGITVLVLGMGAMGALLAVVAGWLRWRSNENTPLARDVCAFRLKLQQTNNQPNPCDRGVSRAMTISQLCEFADFFHGHIGTRNMHYVCHNLVKPLTSPLKLSYAELAGPSQVQWFVSHFWGTPFESFVSSVKMHALAASGEVERRRRRVVVQKGESAEPATNDWYRTSYWICTFSNSQWKLEEELGQLEEKDPGKSWQHSSFYKVLSSGLCSGTVMVFDQEAQPLTRSWCLFELLQTKKLKQNTGRGGFKGLLLCTPSGVMNYGYSSMDLAMTISAKLAKLRLETAEASKASDKEMIDNLVLESGGFAEVNAFVIQAVRDVLSVMQVRFQQELRMLQDCLNNPDGLTEAQALEYCVSGTSLGTTVNSSESLPHLLGKGGDSAKSADSY